MLRITIVALLFLIAGVGAALAEPQQAPATEKCRTAEINPVTGSVICIDPIGAPVEAPPEAALPCKPEQSRGQWTWAPSCTPEPPQGM
jgi:hypothetical protein